MSAGCCQGEVAEDASDASKLGKLGQSPYAQTLCASLEKVGTDSFQNDVVFLNSMRGTHESAKLFELGPGGVRGSVYSFFLPGAIDARAKTQFASALCNEVRG